MRSNSLKPLSQDAVEVGSGVTIDIILLRIENLFSCDEMYRVSQEERSIFWEVILSLILRKKCIYKHVSYTERFPIFGAQYFEFGAQYFPSLPLYEESQQPPDASHRFTCSDIGALGWERRKILRAKYRNHSVYQ
jgi:hypothetical protein